MVCIVCQRKTNITLRYKTEMPLHRDHTASIVLTSFIFFKGYVKNDWKALIDYWTYLWDDDFIRRNSRNIFTYHPPIYVRSKRGLSQVFLT